MSDQANKSNRGDRAGSERDWDRRTFLKQGAFAGASVLGLRSDRPHRAHARTRRARRHASSGPPPPNILTIIVDQLRTPVWMPPSSPAASVMPNLAALRERSVSFERHYTAANDCSPSRSVLLTGLHTHQTGVMITGAGWLDPRFPDVGHDCWRRWATRRPTTASGT